jgi:Ca-activated chloride channel family protein
MFLNENLLILLLLIPLALVLLIAAEIERGRARRLLGELPLLRGLTNQSGIIRRVWKVILWVTALGFGLVALARPVWGVVVEVEQLQGISILLVIDVSQSMNAEDIAPSRIERARLAASDIVSAMGGENQIGLVLFAGTAFVRFPLTTDVETARLFLDAVDTDAISYQGTALEQAVDTALSALPDAAEGGQVIVLLTDGENHSGDPLAAADRARERGVVIHVIGYGSDAGAPIPLSPGSAELRTDASGEPVLTRLDEPILRQIAEATGGVYQRADSLDVAVQTLLAALRDAETFALASETRARPVEWFWLFALFAVIALSVEILIPETRGK